MMRPCGPYLCCSSVRCGIDVRHGGHLRGVGHENGREAREGERKKRTRAGFSVKRKTPTSAGLSAKRKTKNEGRVHERTRTDANGKRECGQGPETSAPSHAPESCQCARRGGSVPCRPKLDDEDVVAGLADRDGAAFHDLQAGDLRELVADTETHG